MSAPCASGSGAAAGMGKAGQYSVARSPQCENGRAPMDAATADVFLDRVERVLRAYGTRLLLSFLIVLSVLPAATLGTVLPAPLVVRLDLVFLALFAPEFALRWATWRRR